MLQYLFQWPDVQNRYCKTGNCAFPAGKASAISLPAPEGFDLPFDMFSACFFLLSRYEEYLPFEPDQYGRFEADQSLAFRTGFLEEPVIDQWLILFKKLLLQKIP